MSEVSGNPEVKERKRPGPKPRQRSVEDMTERDRDQAGLSLDPREQAAHEPNRPKRVIMQGAMKLSIPEGLIKPDYTPHWFRGTDSRIDEAKAAYWEHINTSDGKQLKRISGPNIMYAMQLPNQYVKEDRELRRSKISARLNKEAAIGPGEYTDNPNNSAIKSSSEDNQNPFNNS